MLPVHIIDQLASLAAPQRNCTDCNRSSPSPDGEVLFADVLAAASASPVEGDVPAAVASIEVASLVPLPEQPSEDQITTAVASEPAANIADPSQLLSRIASTTSVAANEGEVVPDNTIPNALRLTQNSDAIDLIESKHSLNDQVIDRPIRPDVLQSQLHDFGAVQIIIPSPTPSADGVEPDAPADQTTNDANFTAAANLGQTPFIQAATIDSVVNHESSNRQLDLRSADSQLPNPSPFASSSEPVSPPESPTAQRLTDPSAIPQPSRQANAKETDPDATLTNTQPSNSACRPSSLPNASALANASVPANPSELASPSAAIPNPSATANTSAPANPSALPNSPELASPSATPNSSTLPNSPAVPSSSVPPNPSEHQTASHDAVITAAPITQRDTPAPRPKNDVPQVENRNAQQVHHQVARDLPFSQSPQQVTTDGADIAIEEQSSVQPTAESAPTDTQLDSAEATQSTVVQTQVASYSKPRGQTASDAANEVVTEQPHVQSNPLEVAENVESDEPGYDEGSSTLLSDATADTNDLNLADFQPSSQTTQEPIDSATRESEAPVKPSVVANSQVYADAQPTLTSLLTASSLSNSAEAKLQNILAPQPINATAAGASQLNLTQQVTEAMAQIVDSSETPSVRTVSLELHPAELGHLQIHVEHTAETISAHIIANESLSSELLQSQKDLLLQSLSDLGFDQASVDISHRDSEGSESQRDSNQRHRKTSSTPNSPDSHAAQNRADSSGGLNIVV